MDAARVSSASSSSDMRSSVESTAAVKRWDSLVRTCASICPEGDSGCIGAPWNVGPAGSASPESPAEANARVVPREARAARPRVRAHD